MTFFVLLAFGRPLVRGDGIAYLAWIDTLVLDQDVNLNNQHDRLRPVNTYQIEWSFERERWVNIFPFGIAFVQAPFYALGHLTQGWINPNPDYFRQMQGLPLAYSLFLLFGAITMTTVAVGLAWRVGRQLVDGWTAALVAFACFIGTPLFYYSTISPVNSHNPGAFALAGFFFLLAWNTNAFNIHADDPDEKKPPRWYLWVLLGVMAGLAVLVRWQLLLAVAPAWLLLAYERHWRGAGIALIAAAVTLLPLPLIWNEMFGAPFLVPFDAVNEQDFIQPRNHTLDVLGHLLLHSPVVLLSLLGIPAMWRVSRSWALLLGGVIVLQLLINGAALDWNAGEAYGMRRMSELYIVYMLLACALVSWLSAQSRQWRRVMRGGLVLLIAYSFVYIAAYMSYTWTNQEGRFIHRPDVMIRYVIEQPHREAVLWEVYRTHAGPLSWSRPGP